MTHQQAKAWLEKSPYSVTDVAKECGVSYNTAYGWFNRRNPSGAGLSALKRMMTKKPSLTISMKSENYELAKKKAKEQGFATAEEWAADLVRRMLSVAFISHLGYSLVAWHSNGWEKDAIAASLGQGAKAMGSHAWEAVKWGWSHAVPAVESFVASL